MGHMQRSSAVSGRRVVKALDMITACYKVEVSLQFKFSTLKEALQSVHGYYGDDFGSGRGEWPRKTAETMLTIFAHARRLKGRGTFPRSQQQAHIP